MGRHKKSEEGTDESKVNKLYFPAETEEAIIQYNQSEDSAEREVIYKKHIAKPLDKLAENVINRFKFPYINQSFDDTKRQVVSFLVINLSRYSQEKGKAFSYFSVIAKNYLILHNTNGYKQGQREPDLGSIEDIMGLEAPNPHEHDDSSEFIKLMIEYWDNNLTRIFKKKRDIDIAIAVVQLFRRADNIENFNKKALYLLIREQTNCKTAYITKVVNKMREHTMRQLAEFHEEGTIDGDEPDYFSYKSP
jgi:hypothetical protein